MENLAKDKYFWQDRDNAFSELIVEDYYPEKDQISDKDINCTIKGSSIYLQGKGVFTHTAGIENVALPSTTGFSFLITTKSPAYGVWGAIQFVEVKPEASFYDSELQLGISDNGVYHIDFKVNKPIDIDKEELIKWQRLSETLKFLQEVYKECSVEDWDGYGATPISIGAYSEAARLLTMLPSSTPLPDITPEPSGEIALEWYKGKKSVFVISLSGNNIISYAGLFGEASKAYGTENLGDLLPKSILENIHRIFPEDQ